MATAGEVSMSATHYNESLYIIEGVDLYGRRFTGAYNKADADYLLATDRLNRLVKVISPCDTINS
jgi:hypothetical protein